MNLRPRNQSLELDGNFRYKAKSNAEKIIDKFNKIYPMHSMENKVAVAPHLLNSQGFIKKNIDFLQQKSRMKENSNSLDVKQLSSKKARKISLKPQYLFP